MKRTHWAMVGLALLALLPVTYAGYSTLIYMEQGGAKQVVASGGEVQFESGSTLDIQAGTVMLLGKTDTEPSGPTEGQIYADDSEGLPKYYTGTGWVALGSGTFTGGSISSDVTLSNGVDMLSTTTTAHTNSIQARDIDGGAYVDILRWTNGDTAEMVLGGATVQFSLASTGLDISTAGAISNATSIAMTGALSGATTGGFSGAVTAGGGLILDSAGTITNSTDSEFRFLDAGEDLILDLDASTNVVGLKSSTGVTGLAMGAVDDLSGVGTIAFDAAASTVTLTSTGDAQDLTIAVAGATNSSLVLNSSGTAADAMTLATSAGGMDITVAGAAANEDLDLLSNTSINVTANEADAAAIVLNAAAGGIDISSAATYDIDITATGGKVLITGNEDAAGAVSLLTSGGGGTSETITITNDQGTAANAIKITATAGGIDIDGGAGGDINIQSTGKSVVVTATEEAADAIKLDASTGAGGITLTAGTGGINITGSIVRTGQQYVQTIGYCKVGATAGWVVPAAADAAHVATLPQSQTASTLVIPITIPLKVGWTITAWTINGQIDSAGNAATLDARLYKHTEAEAGFANAAVGDGMTQVSKTADYKVVDGESGLTEVVAADESFYLLVTGTTDATTDIEIASVTVTVSEI